MLDASSTGSGVCVHVAHSARLRNWGPEASLEAQAVLPPVDSPVNSCFWGTACLPCPLLPSLGLRYPQQQMLTKPVPPCRPAEAKMCVWMTLPSGNFWLRASQWHIGIHGAKIHDGSLGSDIGPNEKPEERLFTKSHDGQQRLPRRVACTSARSLKQVERKRRKCDGQGACVCCVLGSGRLQKVECRVRSSTWAQRRSWASRGLYR